VENDAPSVIALTERGIFDNLLLADVTKLTRRDIDLPAIDVVFVGDTIEHLAEPGRMLEVVTGLSDPHTQLVLTTPNALGMNLFLKNLRGQEIEGADHVCSFNAYTLANMVERYGWRVEELWTCYQPKAADFNPYTFRLGRAALSRFPRLGGTLFAVCSRS
jgi:2-polyprenyl-3-methyl-5-hydroxy-6-metoxy-1,4-benzoquinol methylase